MIFDQIPRFFDVHTLLNRYYLDQSYVISVLLFNHFSCHEFFLQFLLYNIIIFLIRNVFPLHVYKVPMVNCSIERNLEYWFVSKDSWRKLRYRCCELYHWQNTSRKSHTTCLFWGNVRCLREAPWMNVFF